MHSNAASELYFSPEHIITKFVSAPGRLWKWRYTNLLLFCEMQAYLEMAQELVVDENILLQTLGMLQCTVSSVWTSLKFECVT